MTENYCNNCVHYRKAVYPDISIKGNHPGLMDLQINSMRMKMQRAEREIDSINSGLTHLPFEPWTLDWCEYLSEEKQEIVSGKKVKMYAICAQLNKEGNCPVFEKIK